MSVYVHGRRYYWSYKKFLIHLAIIVFIISFWMMYISNVAKATSVKKTFEITVHHGDTLWSIAHRIAPESDPRDTIKNIKNLNQISKSGLIAGQKLQIVIADNI
jgi:hypothetical protein